MTLQGEPNQFCIIGDTEFFHDSVFVESNGSRSNFQMQTDLLHRVALCDELKNFALSIGQLLGVGQRLRVAKGNLFHPLSYWWGNILTSAEHLVDGL